MKKVKKNKINPVIAEKKIHDATSQYISIINSDTEYSLEVDPTNKYSLSENHKKFIRAYINFKNIELAANSANIPIDEAMSYFVTFSTQQEIKRINIAMYQQQFAQKLLSLDDIGGYLSSLLMDVNVPLADRLKVSEKLHVAQMIIDLNTYKYESMSNPEILVMQDIDKELQNLSIDSIKQLISTSDVSDVKNKSKNDDSENNELIHKINVNNSLSDEELAYLKTLSITELTNFVNSLSELKNKKNEV